MVRITVTADTKSEGMQLIHLMQALSHAGTVQIQFRIPGEGKKFASYCPDSVIITEWQNGKLVIIKD